MSKGWKKYVSATAAIAGVVALTVPSGTQAAGSPVSAGCGSLHEAATLVGHVQRARQALGFRCDAGYVQSLVGSRSVHDEAQQPFGLFLSAEENAEMALRQGMAQAMAAKLFAAYVTSLPGFAGDYIDNQDGGKAVFLFTSAPAARQRDVAARFPQPDRVEVRQVAHTRAALADLQARIVHDIPALEASGMSVNTVDTNVAANAVVVSVAEPTPDVRSRLASAYAGPDELVVQQGTAPVLTTTPGVCVIPPPTSPRCGVTDAPTFKGGQEIDNVNSVSQINPSITICTSGFTVGRFAFPAGTTPFVLTAGHCGTDQAQWSQQSTPMGTVQANAFRGGVDGMIISVPAATTSNQVFFDYFGGPLYHTVNAVQGQDTDTVGQWVCHAGIRTGQSCGTIQSKTLSLTISGITYNNLRTATTQTEEGDSGGSVYAISCVSPPNVGCSNNVTAAGTVMGKVTIADSSGTHTYMMYPHIYDQAVALSVSVLTS
jgi:hypothetical protein